MAGMVSLPRQLSRIMPLPLPDHMQTLDAPQNTKSGQPAVVLMHTALTATLKPKFTLSWGFWQPYGRKCILCTVSLLLSMSRPKMCQAKRHSAATMNTA